MEEKNNVLLEVILLLYLSKKIILTFLGDTIIHI